MLALLPQDSALHQEGFPPGFRAAHGAARTGAQRGPNGANCVGLLIQFAMEQPLYNEYAAQLADQQYRQLNAQYETEAGKGGRAGKICNEVHPQQLIQMTWIGGGTATQKKSHSNGDITTDNQWILLLIYQNDSDMVDAIIPTCFWSNICFYIPAPAKKKPLIYLLVRTAIIRCHIPIVLDLLPAATMHFDIASMAQDFGQPCGRLFGRLSICPYLTDFRKIP